MADGGVLGQYLFVEKLVYLSKRDILLHPQEFGYICGLHIAIRGFQFPQPFLTQRRSYIFELLLTILYTYRFDVA